jgi:hypothetical protein
VEELPNPSLPRTCPATTAKPECIEDARDLLAAVRFWGKVFCFAAGAFAVAWIALLVAWAAG